jgi:hypothetical protein
MYDLRGLGEDQDTWFQPIYQILLATPDIVTTIPNHVSLRPCTYSQADTQGHPLAKSFISRPD